jgi:alkyl hydroperoxide reductase subunit D
MDALQAIKDRLPPYAKDVKLNLDAVLFRGSLAPGDALGAALAAAFAAKSPDLIRAFRDSAALDPKQAEAALTAASLMAMNNVWYPFVEMADDPELKTMRPELRMNAYATHGGVDRRAFELYALAASIVGKCQFCVRSHYKLLRESGMSTQELRDVGRIAAVVAATAQALDNAEASIAATA